MGGASAPPMTRRSARSPNAGPVVEATPRIPGVSGGASELTMTQKPAGALCEPARLLEELQTDRRKPRVSGIDTSAPYIDPKVCCGAQPHSFPPHRCEPSSLDRPPALASSFHEKALGLSVETVAYRRGFGPISRYQSGSGGFRGAVFFNSFRDTKSGSGF